MAEEDLTGAVLAIQGLSPYARMKAVIHDIEVALTGAESKTIHEIARVNSSSPGLLRGVLELKRIASPRDTYVHEAANAYIRAHSSIQALCSMLAPGEVVVAISLGAGTSERCCSVVTNRRVMEFRFQRWRQPEEDAARIPHFMADLFLIAEDPSHLQQREVYVIDLARPRLFLETTALTVGAVLSGTGIPQRHKFALSYRQAAPKLIPTYWADAKTRVRLRDLAEVAPGLRRTLSRLPAETLGDR